MLKNVQLVASGLNGVNGQIVLTLVVMEHILKPEYVMARENVSEMTHC